MEAGDRNSSAPPEKPRLLLGDFELLKRIGGGSYGDVWLARNVLGGYRAVKIIERGRFREERPFNREFEGIRIYEPISRSHESLVTIFHAARYAEDAFFYYVMEVADDLHTGQTIDPKSYTPRTLATALKIGEPLAAAEALRVTMALAGALVHLHGKGLIHRDIKPSNIIFVDGVPKLADIGLVAVLGESASFVGTEGFVPPEGPGSIQADIYSLGKVLYEMISGKDRAEFPELPREWVGRADRQALIELNEICLKACHSDVNQRHQSASELLADLAILQSGRSVKRLREAEARAAQLTKGLALAAVVAVLALGAWLFSDEQLRTAVQNAQQSEELRVSAKRAEKMARHQLHNALLSQAEALRMTHKRAGSIAKAWQAVTDAAAIQVDERTRNEAIALAAYPDLHHEPVEAAIHAGTTAFAFSDDLELYAVGTGDGELSVGSLATGERHTIHASGEKPLVDLLHISPDKRWLAVRYQQLSCWIYDLATTNVVLKTRWGTGLTKPDRAFDFSPNGSHAASAVTESIVRIFQLPAWSHGPALTVGGKPTWIAFSPDSRSIAVAAGKQVEVWGLASLKKEAVHQHSSEVFCVDWRRDSKELAMGTTAGQVVLWNLESGGKQSFTAHAGLILRVDYNPRGALLLTSSHDRTTRLWDLRSGEMLVETDEGFGTRFSSTNNNVAFVREAQRLSVREFTESPAFRTWQPPGRLGAITRLRVNDDNSLLATSMDGLALTTASGRRIIAGKGAAFFDGLFLSNSVFVGTEKGISQLAVTETAELRPVWNAPKVSRIAARRDGEELVVASDLKVERVQPGTWQSLGQWENHSLTALSNICDLTLSPDQQTVAVSGWYGRAAILLSLPDFQERVVPARTCRLAFTPDGSALAVGMGEMVMMVSSQTLQHTGKPFYREVAAEEPGSLAFSPDGRVLAVLHNFRDITLLNGKTREPLARLKSPRNEVVSEMTFHRNGQVLLFGTKEGGVYSWHLGRLRETVEGAGISLNL
ncbi:MAG TPA: serine/threonine-protein kinase [Methylomirabilota bacterium]|nr:serine/threonine-protein kinase [Methylomirabilota bacterium]